MLYEVITDTAGASALIASLLPEAPALVKSRLFYYKSSLESDSEARLAALAVPHLVVFLRRIRGEDRLLFALPGYADRMGAKGALLPRLRR